MGIAVGELGHGLRQFVWALAACLVTASAIAVADVVAFMIGTDDGRDRPFGGWQLYLAVACVGLAAVLVVTLCSVLLTRVRHALPTEVSGRAVLTLSGVCLGAIVGFGVAHGTHRVLDWSSNHTAAAHRAAAHLQAELRLAYGTAEHPPYAHSVTEPIPLEAKSLITPDDLGDHWYYGYGHQPRVRVDPSLTDSTDLPISSRASELLLASHWDGTKWATDQDVVEYANRFASHADARRWLRRRVTAATTCELATLACGRNTAHFVRVHVAHGVVWRDTTTLRSGLLAYALNGDTVVYVRSFAPLNRTNSTRSSAQILRAAVRRLTASADLSGSHAALAP